MVRLEAHISQFRYPDGTLALSDIHIQIRRGEFAGILGSNGSGKTTLLKTLDGLIKDVRGNIYLDGKEIKNLSPKEIYSKVGLIFQNPNDQLFAPTVFEDVAFGPTNMGFNQDEIDRRVRGALKDVDMQEFSKKSIHHLSFGQKKRICIAGLLAMGHEILLLDEPTAGLDAEGEYKMMNLLMKLNREKNVTILMATHSIDLIPLFLQRLYILNQGSIVRSGAPEDIFNTPEEMTNVKLRLPQVSELIYRLKHEEQFPIDKIPLTIGEAKRAMTGLFDLMKSGKQA